MYGHLWRPGECLPNGLQTASLKVVGDYLPPQGSRPETPGARYNTPDPDYEHAENILDRLDDNTPLININCDCLIQKSLTKKQQDLYSSQQFSDSDSDDEGTSLVMLMKMLKILPSRLPSKTASKALQTVVESYNCNETITKEQLSDICVLMKHNNTTMKDLTLTLMAKLGGVPANVDMMIDVGVLDELLTSIKSSHLSIQPSVLKLIQVIVSHADLKDKWLDPVSCEIYPLLLTYLQKDGQTLDCKYSICCVFRELVQYTEYIEVTQSQIIPAVSKIKDSSGKLREVYTEILTGLLLHTDVLPPGIIDNGIVPSTVGMIRDGPCGTQVQALKLLSGLTDKDSGVPAVIENTYAVPYIVCCIKESNCRKVKKEALKTLCHLTRSRRLGLCKDFMVHVAGYLTPTDGSPLHQIRPSSATGNRVNSPSRGRHVEKDSVLWKALNRLIKIVGKLLIKESLAESDKSGKGMTVGYKPCIDMCPVRVTSLCRCVLLLQNICAWPSGKNKQDHSMFDLKNFTDSESQRSRLCKLNRHLVQKVWDNVGTTVVQLLGAFSDKLTNVQSLAQRYRADKGNLCSTHSEGQPAVSARDKLEAIDKMVDKKGLVDLSCIFEVEELDLVKALLELLLCIALCSCKEFPDLLPKKLKSPHHISNQGHATRSDSSLGKPPLPRKLTRPSSAHHQRSTSPVKELRLRQSWVPENPHLTTTLERSSSSTSHDINHSSSKTDVGHFHAELMKKEAATERRIIRKCLYEADTVRIVGAFLKCSQHDLQTLACQILRCCIQPLEEKVYPQAAPPPGSQRQKLTRPQSATSSREVDYKMKVAFHYMSPEIAHLIKEALGPDFVEVAKAQEEVKVQTTSFDDSEVVNRLSHYMKSKDPIKIESREQSCPKPVVDICRPIAAQCRECLLKEVGTSIVSGIFYNSKEARKSVVMLLQDLVHLGDVENHRTLSQYGCMQRLMDFIRVNKDDELLEIIGLIIIQMLVTSDDKIKQIFNRHGGTRLLSTMTGLTTGLLREEVAKTLHAVSNTKGPGKKLTRPSSAPLSRTRTQPSADVWDNIQDQWESQDRVCKILGSGKK